MYNVAKAQYSAPLIRIPLTRYLMKMLTLQPIFRITDASTFVYHIFVFLSVAFSGWRATYWTTHLEFFEFEWKHLLGVIHVALVVCVPFANIAWFGFFVKFDFESWRRQWFREIRLRDDDIIDTDINVLTKMFVYSNPILIVLYTTVLLNLTDSSMNIYDYFPLVLLELLNIAPALRYLDIALDLQMLHNYVSNQIPLYKNYYRNVRVKYKYAYTGDLPSFNRRNTKILFKLQLDTVRVGCTVLSREFGISLILLVLSYSMSLVHDSAYLMNLHNIWALILSAFRSAHKLTFLIVFFIIGHSTSCAMKNATRLIHDTITRQPTFVIDRQIMAMIMGYVVVQIQFQSRK